MEIESLMEVKGLAQDFTAHGRQRLSPAVAPQLVRASGCFS